jgi:hypothetical protein
MKSLRAHKYGLLAVVLGIVTTIGWADSPIQWRGSKGWEPESAYCRLYDAKHVETIKGTVQRVEKIVPMEGMGEGVYMMLQTGTEILPVHLGPKEYVEKQPIQFLAGDVVDVTGSRVSCNGKPAFLAAVVKRGTDTAKYRSLKGIPGWAAPTSPKQ